MNLNASTTTISLKRGLSRLEAASYVGVSPVTFDKLIAEKIMPPPLQLRSRKVWDRLRIDAAFESLADNIENNDLNAWDDVEWD